MESLRKANISTKKSSAPSRHQVGTKLELSAKQLEVLGVCTNPLPILKLLEIVKRSDRTKFRKKVLNPLIEEGLIAMTNPDSPNSPKQRYKTTQQGANLIKGDERKDGNDKK